MVNESIQNIIKQHFEELTSKYTDLKLTNYNDSWTIQGFLGFEGIFKGASLEGDYEVKIILPKDYPDTPPTAQETSGRIPRNYEHISDDGTLCLGAPLEVRMVFAKHPTLLGFVEKLVIPYFYSYSYYEKNNKMPFGELSGGGKGILEYYRDLFNVLEELHVAGLLKILADSNYRGHDDCPCESGKRLRQCHGNQLLDVCKYQTPEDFLTDYYQVLNNILKSGEKKIPERCLSRSLAKLLKKSNAKNMNLKKSDKNCKQKNVMKRSTARR